MLIKYKFRLDAICTNICDEYCRFKRNGPEAELQKHCDNCHQFMTLYDLIETVYSDAYRQGQLATLPENRISGR